MVVHAGIETGLAVFGKGVGSHCQNRQLGLAGQAADQARRLEPAHDRHLDIHQDQREILGLHAFERFRTVRREFDAEPGEDQQFLGDFLVDRFVLDEQHAAPGMGLRNLFLKRDGRHAAACGDGRRLAFGEPGREPEQAAAPDTAFDTDIAAHQLGEVAIDRQAEAGTAVTPGDRTVGLGEGLEKLRLLLGSHADALVTHFEAEQHMAAFVTVDAGAQDNFTVLGKLDGIADEIEQGLTDAHRVTPQQGRHGRANRSAQDEALAQGALFEHGKRLRHDLAGRKLALLERQTTGFDLRQVEDVVDDIEQVARRIADLGQPVLRLGIADITAQQMGQADDGIHRRADFMAHVGEEGTLRPARRLGCLLGFGQFGGTRLDERLEMVAVMFELGLDPLARGDVGRDAAQRVDRAVRLAQRHLDRQVGAGDVAVGRRIDFLLDHPLAVFNDAPVVALDIGARRGIEEARIVVPDDLGQRLAEQFAYRAIGVLVAVVGTLDVDVGLDAVENDAEAVLVLAQGVFRLLALGDVFLDREIVDGLAGGIEDRRDRRLFPEQGTVLAPVVENAVPGLTGGNRRPQRLLFGDAHLFRTEQPGIAADHFAAAVAGQLLEFGVNVLDPAAGIGNHDRGRALLDGTRQDPQLVGLPAQGFLMQAVLPVIADEKLVRPAREKDGTEQADAQCPQADQ